MCCKIVFLPIAVCACAQNESPIERVELANKYCSFAMHPIYAKDSHIISFDYVFSLKY
jgi:hypothetical protein